MPIDSSGFILRYRENEHNFFLILKSRWVNSWSFPKGLMEKNETPFLTAVRELFEETGITTEDFILENTAPIQISVKVPKTKQLQSGKKKILLFFGFLVRSPKITLSKEHGAFRFVDLADLKILMPDYYDSVKKKTMDFERFVWLYESWKRK